VLDLVDGLRRAGLEVDVCAFYPPASLTRHFATLGVEVTHLGRRPRVSAGAIGRFWRLLRAGRYDVIHLYGARVNVVGRLAARLLGGPKVVSALRSLYPGDRDARAVVWLDRTTVRWVDAYVSNSRAAIDFLVGRGFPRSLFRWVPSGIDPAPFGRPVDREAVLERLGIRPGGRPVVISVANLRPMKGHALLLAALGQLRRRGVECLTLLVGEGPLREALAAQVAREGLAERVCLTGSRPDVAELLAASDVFVLASSWEGLPRSVLEAMASRRPVVATAVGGVGELVEDGQTGFLAPAGDADALASRLGALLADPQLRAEMGARGRARVEKEFSVERMVEGTVAVYRELVDGRRPGG
jgi:glycosyltransferase involved in cell wall biosynthesis